MNNIETIIKLLNLSQSKNDHEALAAIRKANQIVLNNEQSWDNLFKNTNKHHDHKEKYENHDHLKHLFTKIYELEGSETSEFIKSVFSFYMKKNYVTLKQYRVIQDYYDRLFE